VIAFKFFVTSRVSMPDAVQIVRISPQLSVGTWANVYFMHVCGEFDVKDLRAAHEVHLALIERCPQGTGVMAIGEMNTAIPGTEVRDLSSRFMRDLSPHVRACATVIRGGGFWASAVRSFLSAVYFVAKQPCPTRAVATIEEGALWLGPRAGQIPSQIVGAALEVIAFANGPARRVSESRGTGS